VTSLKRHKLSRAASPSVPGLYDAWMRPKTRRSLWLLLSDPLPQVDARTASWPYRAMVVCPRVWKSAAWVPRVQAWERNAVRWPVKT